MGHSGWILWCILLIPASLVAEGLEDERDHITFAFGFDPAVEPLYRFFDRLYTEAFSRLGYQFSYRVYPLARCSLAADAGIVDGEPLRRVDYGKDFHNLLRVDEPVFTNRILAFVTMPEIDLKGWADMTGKPWRAKYIQGAVGPEMALQGVLPESQYSSVNSVSQALDMLLLGRIEVFFDLESRVVTRLIQNPQHYGAIRAAGVMDSHDGYIWLHKSRSGLAAPLSRILKDLKLDGTYKRLQEEYLPGIRL